ncbi:GNAT family N-acetyltransferase [Leucothrix arctica]|uniref:Histone acetyltransferase n=1 Tax=Leucothrix arctica TaxID=1481894 RepID=A0A317CAG1_9GAMM|nr:GNAT family N-acetyltransferase [Leucothrix arctica]PWQ95675.1 histone acetyltransferase [Leucothrix arctica]
MNIDFVLSPSEEEIAEIYNGLAAFNEPYFPNLDQKGFAYLIRDEDGKILGGLTGKTLFTAFHVNLLWLSEPIRGLGYGTKLMQQAEQEAKDRGAINAFVDTYSFQAPTFYERLGYNEVGRYTDFPRVDVDKVFFKKCLVDNKSPSPS